MPALDFWRFLTRLVEMGAPARRAPSPRRFSAPMNGYNFTERVRRVLASAREEAAALHHEYVGTEHILLGLLREVDGVAAAVLGECDVDRNDVRERVLSVIRAGQRRPESPDIPYTSRAKRVLELAMSEARQLNHTYVGTEHIFLGLIREEKGIAAQVLVASGITLDLARAETLRLLGGAAQPSSAGSAEPGSSPKRRPRGNIPAAPETPSGGHDLLRVKRTLRSLPPTEWATDRARTVLVRARDEATSRHSRHIEPEHLLISLLQEDGGMASTLMEQLGTDRAALERAAAGAIEETLATDEPFDLEIDYSGAAEAALRHAFHAARAGRDRRVGTDHLLLGLLLEETAPASRVLLESGLTADAVRAKRTRIVG